MAEISKITLPSGTTYDIKDATARASIAGGVAFLGVTTTALTDGATTNPITVSGESVTAINGSMVVYGNKEFVFATNDNKWHEFGDTSSLGDLASKDSASGTYTPAGTVSQPTFTGTQATIKPKVTAAGSVEISTGSGTANYTPAGTVSQPTTTVTLNTASKYVASSATGGGSVTAGTAASATMPVLTTSVANETLTLGWTAGSFTANTPTAVTLPSFSSQTIATSVKSATTTQPTFTGTGVDLEATFTGTEVEGSATYTPAGSVSQPTFTGTQATITVS